jgi:hypothetical protein
VIVAAALGAAVVASCLGPTAGEVQLTGFDAPAEKQLAFPAGKELDFAVHVEGYKYSGANNILLDVTLLRGGAPVGNMSCAGFRVKGGSGCGSSATHLNSGCSMKVPPGGSDAIRVVATRESKSNSLTAEGLSVYIRD